ncbi:MAG: ATP-binding protein [Clostridium sp.]|nr:ATP-binding protein [Clostridium sp.]
MPEKKPIFKDFPINKEYGDDEPFFRVITPHGEVHLNKMPFQKGQPLPDTLNCRIKGYNGPDEVIGHNMPRYVSEFYADGFSKGQEFDFKVVAKPTDEVKFYRLADENGLQFRLTEPNAKLAIGQTIKCRFELLDQNVYALRRSSADTQLRMQKMLDLTSILGVSRYTLGIIEQELRNIPELAEAIEELDRGLPSWIITASRAIKTLLPKWFSEFVEGRNNLDQAGRILDGYKRLLLHLLQGSDFLRNIKGDERTDMQTELTNDIEQIDVYIKTLNIIRNHNQKAFINDLLRHLKVSGYIFHPEEQFAILMILFRLTPELVNSSLGSIFDTLMGWYQDTWKAEPFRRAFVDQLEIYISDTREQIDHFLTPETSSDNEMIERMLTAIAIQQSLALPEDHIDLRLNMSFFFRCLSLLRRAKAETLLTKSLMSLMNVKLPTDFTWSDIKEPTMMMTRATVDPPKNATLPAEPKFFEAGTVEFEISDAGLTLRRIGQNGDKQIPNNMMPWMNAQVEVDIPHPINRQKMKSLEGHSDFWSEVEDKLFEARPKSDTFGIVKRNADIDDIVKIEIDRVIPSSTDPSRPEAFHCKVVDDHFLDKEGIIRAEEIVAYTLHNVTTGVFRNNQGEPLQLNATVIDIDYNDTVEFSLLDATRGAYRDLTWSGDKCYCVVTKDNGHSYSAISEKGFGLFVNKYPDDEMPFRPGTVLLVSVTDFNNDAVHAVIEEGPIDGKFINNANALHNLLQYIAVNDDKDTIDLGKDDLDLMSKSDVREIVEILHYKAVTTNESLIQAYDYLSFANILARAIGDQQLVNALRAHKSILLLQQQYDKDRQIFIDDIERVKALAPGNALIERMATKLRIVACLGHSDENEWLWQITSSANASASDKELAQMTLSHNLLYDISFDNPAAAAIKDSIAKALNVYSEARNLKYYGSESQFIEFKSSLVYPAQKGKSGISMADPDKQEHEILHIISSFMNTTGGTLYIGVSDDHYERGLEEDFKFYKLDNSERNNMYRRKIKNVDNMVNHLQNLIDKAFNLGSLAGEFAKAFVDDEASKSVIYVKVKPCPRVVTLNDVIYVRHGNNTKPLLDPKEIEIFRADRNAMYNREIEANRETPRENKLSMPAIPTAAKAQKDLQSTAKSSANEETTANEASLLLNLGSDKVATSRIRKNVLHDFGTEHFVTPNFYIRFVDDHEYIVTDDEWSIDEENDRIALTVTDDEADQTLLLVYDDESALKVPLREISKKKRNVRHAHNADKKLVFACPIHDGDGLYSLHSNSKGSIFERVTPVDTIVAGSMGSAPSRLLEAECKTWLYDIVPASRMREFDDIKSTNLRRSQVGQMAKSGISGKVTADSAAKDFYRKFKI